MPKINAKPAMTPFAAKMRNVKLPKGPKRPLWDGPESDSDNGGVTQSLLSRFLTCRERFRLKVIEGFRTVEAFSHLLEYGNMWHVCEEALAGNQDYGNELTHYCKDLLHKYPLQRQQVEHWYDVCRMQFPLYVDHWSKHPDVANRTPLMEEQVFKIPYRLPSGRVVWLRGKYDSVDLVEIPKSTIPGAFGFGIWLQENKTKGDIDEQDMRRQLTNDLQTMIYLVALTESQKMGHGWSGCGKEDAHAKECFHDHPIKGVRYNVIRRPLSGGKGSIKQHEGKPSEPCSNCEGTGRTLKLKKVCSRCKGVGRTQPVPPETREHFMERLAQYVKDEPEHWFMRWNVEVSVHDVERFRKRTLDPILEQLCLWYECVAYATRYKLDPFTFPFSDDDAFGRWKGIHWQHPYGADNSVDFYGRQDVDSYMETGNQAGLQRVENLFPELT